MTVTEITEVSKSRKKIWIDEEFAFVLYNGELRSYGIEQDKEISEEAYHAIMTQLLPKRAKLRAMNLLQRRSYTVDQLKDKLAMGGYPGVIVEEAIEYVASFNYVNDERYACDFIECNKEKKSKRRIFQDLAARGISGELAQAAWEQTAGEDAGELEKEQILHWIQKKNFDSRAASPKEKQKMMAFLYRKGFSADNIRNALLLDITSI